MKYIVVLGAPIVNEHPGNWLKSRLDKCIRLYNELSSSSTSQIKIILSGCGYQNIPESVIMYNYLEKYIPNNILYTEQESRNTFENAIESYKLLNKMNFNINDDIYIVTSDFHIERAMFIFSKIDMIINNLGIINKKKLNIYPVCAETLRDKDYYDAIEHEKHALEYLYNKYHVI